MQILIIGLADICGQALQTYHLRSTPAALTADDDVVAIVVSLNGDGLDDTQLTDRVGQLIQSLVIELCSGLCGVGYDFVYGYLCHLVHGRCLYRWFVGSEYGIQTSS